MNQKIERWVLWGIAGVFAVYVAARAWLIPIVADEADTAINHVPRLVVDTLFYQKEVNPNNHILNTLLIKTFAGMFGWHHFVVRLPAVLAGLLYGYSSVQLASKTSNYSWTRIFVLMLLLGNPYLLEFFSIGKGFGPALGLMSVAFLQAWNYLDSGDSRYFKRAMLFICTAVYAHFSLLLVFVPFFLMLTVAAWRNQRDLKVFWTEQKRVLINSGVFVLLWLSPLLLLKKQAVVADSKALGSFFESIRLSVKAAIQAHPYLGENSDLTLARALCLGLTAVFITAAWRWKSNGFQLFKDPKLWFTALLGLVGIANLIAAHGMKIPFLSTKQALLYWPLIALVLGFAASWIEERYGRKIAWVYMGPVYLLLLINTFRSVNLHQAMDWYHDSDTFTVLEFLKKTYEEEGRKEPFVLDADWFMQNSFTFHLDKKYRGYDRYVKLVPYHGQQIPQKNSDFYFALNHDSVRDVLDAYDIVLRIPNSSMILLRKKP